MWFTCGQPFALTGGAGVTVSVGGASNLNAGLFNDALPPLKPPGAAAPRCLPPPFALGGPCEAFGRLRYIDGCSDSLLVGPAVRGDPCLNHLHFPPGVSQTR
jgi:hypothetical protein